MKRKHREEGQAIAEFVVCLIAILFVFLGVLAMGVLSMESVSCLIGARSDADVASALGSSVGGSAPEQILEWDRGPDGIPFTADDEPVTGMGSESFARNFNTREDVVEGTESVPMTLAELAKNGYADGRAGETTFLAAANLNGYTHTETDPLSKRGLPELQNMLRRIVGGGKFVLKDTVFIPAKVD